ncbi:MAG: hypothetical protein IKT62_06045, partial [Firmicutes bacterium]|nr:hypothetical protein [Bacillota bacterium]
VDSTGITTAQKDAWIMAYLNEQESDENGTYKSMRDVADRLYRAIKKAGIAADNNLTGNNDEIAQGYWIFADVTGLTNQNEANSLVMVDTAGQDPVVITPKTGLPTIEKKYRILLTVLIAKSKIMHGRILLTMTWATQFHSSLLQLYLAT